MAEEPASHARRRRAPGPGRARACRDPARPPGRRQESGSFPLKPCVRLHTLGSCLTWP